MEYLLTLLIAIVVCFVVILLIKKSTKRRKNKLQYLIDKENLELRKLHKKLNIKSKFKPLI